MKLKKYPTGYYSTQWLLNDYHWEEFFNTQIADINKIDPKTWIPYKRLSTEGLVGNELWKVLRFNNNQVRRWIDHVKAQICAQYKVISEIAYGVEDYMLKHPNVDFEKLHEIFLLSGIQQYFSSDQIWIMTDALLEFSEKQDSTNFHWDQISKDPVKALRKIHNYSIFNWLILGKVRVKKIVGGVHFHFENQKDFDRFLKKVYKMPSVVGGVATSSLNDCVDEYVYFRGHIFITHCKSEIGTELHEFQHLINRLISEEVVNSDYKKLNWKTFRIKDEIIARLWTNDSLENIKIDIWEEYEGTFLDLLLVFECNISELSLLDGIKLVMNIKKSWISLSSDKHTKMSDQIKWFHILAKLLEKRNLIWDELKFKIDNLEIIMEEFQKKVTKFADLAFQIRKPDGEIVISLLAVTPMDRWHWHIGR